MGNITGVIVGALVIYFVLNNLLPALPPNVTALANLLGLGSSTRSQASGRAWPAWLNACSSFCTE